jgi:hypothetical protein
MAVEPFETAEAQSFPCVRQLSVFLENRVGQLLRMTQILQNSGVRILSLSAVNAVDCAILRLLVDDTDEARDILTQNSFATSESEVVVVVLPEGRMALLTVCAALLQAEVNINYAYPLLTPMHGRPALAIQLDNLQMGIKVLQNKDFEVLDESDLVSGGH